MNAVRTATAEPGIRQFDVNDQWLQKILGNHAFTDDSRKGHNNYRTSFKSDVTLKMPCGKVIDVPAGVELLIFQRTISSRANMTVLTIFLKDRLVSLKSGGRLSFSRFAVRTHVLIHNPPLGGVCIA